MTMVELAPTVPRPLFSTELELNAEISQVYEEPEYREDGNTRAPGWKGKEKMVYETESLKNMVITPEIFVEDEQCHLTEDSMAEPSATMETRAESKHRAEDDEESENDEDISMINEGDVDWEKYDPPAGMADTDGIESEIIVRIIHESIQRIKSRIAEEQDQKNKQEALINGSDKQQVEMPGDGASAPDGDNTHDDHSSSPPSTENTPNIEPDDPPISPTSMDSYQNHQTKHSRGYSMRRMTMRSIQSSTSNSNSQTSRDDSFGLLAPPMLAFKPNKKRSLFERLRKINSGKGESSAMGAVRSKLQNRDHFPSRGQGSWSAAQADRTLFGFEVMMTNTTKNFKKSDSGRVGGENANNTTSSLTIVEEDREVECVSCLDDFPAQETVKAAPCHRYCRDCFRRLVSAACDNEAQWPPKCCLNRIPDVVILKELSRSSSSSSSSSPDDSELRRRWREKGAEWDTPASERIYCHESTCGAWIRPENVDRAARVARCSHGSTFTVRVLHETCTLCRGPAHGGGGDPLSATSPSPCPQDFELERTTALATEEGWQRCPGCQAYVEHREACQHMTCLCGAQFCYVCGATWRTCGCGMGDLARKKARVEEGRRVREIQERERERREREEREEAIRQVEEFEREERRKKELERRRKEEERVEREKTWTDRMHRELDRKYGEEEMRRKEVMGRFEWLSGVLGEVGRRQKEGVVQVWEKRGEELEGRLAEEENKLRETQERDQREWVDSAAMRVATREAEFKAEYDTRLQGQQSIIDGYAAQLEAYWKGKTGGEQHVGSALEKLRLRMEGEYQEWKRYRDGQIDSLLWNNQEEATIREELRSEGRRRHRSGKRRARRENCELCAAEACWVAELESLRGDMLRQAERDEMENGGEDLEAWWNAEQTAFEQLQLELGMGVVGGIEEFSVAAAAITDDEEDDGGLDSTLLLSSSSSSATTTTTNDEDEELRQLYIPGAFENSR